MTPLCLIRPSGPVAAARLTRQRLADIRGWLTAAGVEHETHGHGLLMYDHDGAPKGVLWGEWLVMEVGTNRVTVHVNEEIWAWMEGRRG